MFLRFLMQVHATIVVRHRVVIWPYEVVDRRCNWYLSWSSVGVAVFFNVPKHTYFYTLRYY